MRRSGTVIIVASAMLAPCFAQAADLEVFKAEPPSIYVPNNFLWGGIYVGGFIGGGWSTADFGPGSVPVSVTTTTTFGTATNSISLFNPKANVPISGFLGGGQVGVNYQAGAFVFGFEGDFTGMTLKGRTTTTFGPTTVSPTVSTVTSTGTGTTTATITYTTTSVYQTRANWASTFTGRMGYTFDRVLAYGKVGVAVEQDGDTEITNTTITTCTTPAPPTTSPATCKASPIARAGTSTRYGWTAGAGLEYALDRHWSGFVEYDHLGFLSQIINFASGPGATVATRSVSLNIDRVVGGANYRF